MSYLTRSPRDGGHRSSRLSRLLVVAGTLFLLVAQLAPAAVYGASGDATVAASLAATTVAPGAEVVVDVAVTCPDTSPAADGGSALMAAVFAAGAEAPVSALTGLGPDGTGHLTFAAPSVPGTYDYEVAVSGLACVDGLGRTAAGTLTVAVPAAEDPTPDLPVGPALGTQIVTFTLTPGWGRAGWTQTTTATTDGDGAITYASDTTGVCTVDASTGLVTEIAAGTCQITATAAATASFDTATNSTSWTIYDAEIPCVDYSAAPYLGAIVLNSDGTVPGCGTDEAHGWAADLEPVDWASSFESDYQGSGDPAWTYRLGYTCDDCWVAQDDIEGDVGLPIGFDINFFGTTYSTVFVNSNGSIAFGNGASNYDDPLDVVLDGAAGVVAYGVDLYNDGIWYTWEGDRHQDFFYWGRTTFEGHQAFAATWINMTDCCDDSNDPLATFQILLVDIDGDAGTDLDIVINYGGIITSNEGYSDSEGCVVSPDNYDCVAIGLGTVDPDTGAVTYASLQDDDGNLYNGRTTDDVSDTGAHPLNQAHLNSDVPGQFRFRMRDGSVPEQATEPGAPVITSTQKGDTEGTANWNEPTDLGGSPIGSYTLRYRVLGAGDDTWTEEPGITDRTFTITSLTNGTTYEVQVAAINGIGQGPWSASAYVTPNVAGAPDWTDIEPIDDSVNPKTDQQWCGSVGATGEPAPTYELTDGTLPPGLTLDPVTGQLCGTPTTPGNYEFTITATNDLGSAPYVFVLAVVDGQIPDTDTIGGGSRPSDLLGRLLTAAGVLLTISGLVLWPRTRTAASRRR